MKFKANYLMDSWSTRVEVVRIALNVIAIIANAIHAD